jgi:hypothetical protein
MFSLIRNSLVLVLALSLTACLKVDNKSNEKVADAIAEQNKILQQQADQASQAKTSVSLTGVINNLSTGAKAINATVKIKVGLTSTEPVAATGGAFQIDNLPAASDYELIVHSTTGAFMDRTVFGQTRAANVPGKVIQDVGAISVAAGVEHKFTIRDAATHAAITNLVLRANSSVGTGANVEQYLHSSTYDATTQEYKITFPEHMGIDVFANLDLNNDGKSEYKPEDTAYGYSGHLDISSSLVDNSNPIYLIDLNVNQNVKIKIAILDATLNPLTNAIPVVNDELNGLVNAVYDATTNQYVLNANLDSNLTVIIPSFSAGGLTYSSSTVQITRSYSSNTNYTLSTGTYSTQFSFAIGVDKVFDAVVRPSVFTPSSALGIVAQSSAVDTLTQAFKVFYTGPVALNSDSAQLVKKNVLRVTKGNDSTTDLILSGTTVVETVDESVDVDTQLSLDNTLLTITPKAPLSSGTYQYSVGNLLDELVNINTNIYGDSLDFTIKNTSTFSINDVKLDNNNFYTNGALIKPTNTAGDASPVSDGSSSVSLYLPPSIENLKSLTLRKEQITRDGVVSNSVADYNVISNGSLSYISSSVAVSLAYNETVTGNYYYYYIVRGATVTDGNWYYVNPGEYMNDNTSVNANSITFSYAFETKDGVQETGTITLPVL